MEPLLTTFVATALAQFGDKTQLLVMALAAVYARPAAIIAGLAVASLASSLIAATAGILIHDAITLRAAALLVALALLYAGATGVMTPAPPQPLAQGRTPAFLAALLYLLASEMGHKSQFLTFALAARFDSLLLAGFGAAAGIVAANVPAALLGHVLAERMPLRALRTAAAVLFLIGGAIVALNALRLV